MNRYLVPTLESAQPDVLRAGVQYLILQSTAKLAWMFMSLLTVYVLLFYPTNLRFVEVPGLLITTVIFLFLRFVAFPKATTTAQLDWISISFLVPGLILTMINVVFAPDHFRGIEPLIVLSTLSCLLLYNNYKLVVWLIIAYATFLVCRYTAEKPINVIEWLTLSILIPWLSLIIRSTVDRSSRSLISEFAEKQTITKELTDQTDYFNAILDRAPLILCVMGGDGKYQHSRGSGLAVLGLEQNQIVGLHFQEVFKEFPTIKSAVQHAFDGNSSIVKADFGNENFYEIRYEPVFDIEQNITGVIGVGIDISERVISENKEIAFENSAIDTQKGESITTLAGGVAHDFNNYITSIVGFCDSLEHMQFSANDSQVVKVVGLIKKCALQAAGVSQQMLRLTGQNAEAESDYEPINLWSFLMDLKPLARAMFAKQTNLAFIPPNDELKQTLILADAVLLQQAVVNVLQNAHDALEGNSGSVEVTLDSLSDDSIPDDVFCGELKSDTQYIELIITDSGCGIASEDLAQIFDLYYTTKTTGHGIGLAVTCSIIKKHQGAIACQSSFESGTRTRLIFPIAPTH